MPRYECDCCVARCQGHLIEEAYLLDLMREPRLKEGDPFYAGRTLDEVTELLGEEGRCIVLAAGRPCRFLSANKRCSIHPTRPNVCVGIEAGDEQWQGVRREAGLPPLEPVEA